MPFRTIGAALLLAAGVFFLQPDIKPHAQHEEKTSIFCRYLPLITSGKARGGFLAYLLLHLGSGASFAFFGKWLADRFALPVGPIGTVMMFLGFGTLLGSLISPHAMRKLGPANAVASAMALLVLLYASSPHASNLSS